MTRAVLDTNTIISGLFWQGAPRIVLDEASLKTFALLMSDELLNELNEVLAREKFSRLRTGLGKSAAEITSDLLTVIELVPSADIPPNAVRDPKDQKILACAIGGQADCIVSGDKDLLILGSFQNIPVMNATRFLQYLVEQAP
jgi:putative PIN family toxin of toxin-antitoxin system